MREHILNKLRLKAASLYLDFSCSRRARGQGSSEYADSARVMAAPKMPMKTEPLNNRNVQGGSHDRAVGFSITSQKLAELTQ